MHFIDTSTSHAQYLMQPTPNRAHPNYAPIVPQVSRLWHSSKEARAAVPPEVWDKLSLFMSPPSGKVTCKATFLRLPSITVPQLCHFYFSWESSTALLHLSVKENVILCHCLKSVQVLELLIRLDFKRETELSPLNSSVPSCLLRRINFDSKAIFEFMRSE